MTRSLPRRLMRTCTAMMLAGLASHPALALVAPPPVARTPADATAHLTGVDGASVGDVQFWQGPGVLLMTVRITSLPPGVHGLHLHAAGQCDPATGFKSAGGHIHQGTGGEHGLLNPKGPEAGDLPNLIVPESGAVAVELMTSLVRLDGDHGLLKTAEGAAVVIHASEDDQISQPIGNAGARIACGVIKGR